MKENYQRRLDEIIQQLKQEQRRPRLLLHSCCAPCSSYVLEYLSAYFDITVFYYNPNIFPQEEFRFRAQEQQALLSKMPLSSPVSFLMGDYDTEAFLSLAKGLENEPEGGLRCKRCYALRLEESAKAAKEGGFDYFTTTLSISPHKDAAALNEIGAALSAKYDIPFLFADFKKKNGYRRSCLLSEEYGLYRQDYCGCLFSKEESAQRKNPQ